MIRTLLLSIAILAAAVPVVAEETGEEEVAAAVVSTANPVVFWELASHDADKSIAFLESVFDWEFNAPEGSALYVARTSNDDGGINGGVFTLQQAKLPFLTVYIMVDDIEHKAELVEKAGGEVLEPPHPIASGSWICLFNDPSGATFAMLQQNRAAPEGAESGED